MAKIQWNTRTESCAAAIAAMFLYLPFLSLQYDTNGIVEALAVEAGDLFHKNHLLYRPLGYVAFHALQAAGYSGRAVVVLQTINAICGAVGIGLAYAAFKKISQSAFAAAAGAALLGCSFIYWYLSTDAAYLTLALMFAAGGMAALVLGSETASAVMAGVLTTCAILTWQGAVFLIPALSLLTGQLRRTIVYAGTACIATGAIYTSVAFARSGVMSPAALLSWLSRYGEGGTLSMWGKWEPQRIGLAFFNGVTAFVPAPLAVGLSEITWTTQRGRILVDVAIVAFVMLAALTAWKTRRRDLVFPAAFLCFAPFIVWWDPFVSNWFVVPNLFLAAYFAAAVGRWRGNATANGLIAISLVLISGTNFITTIRPRSRDIGLDRSIAQCVAAQMKPQDIIFTAHWGWPDYLEYLHNRTRLSLISQFASIDEALTEIRSNGGAGYIVDPDSYSDEHIAWLQEQSGARREDMIRLAGPLAFECYGTKYFRVLVSDRG